MEMLSAFIIILINIVLIQVVQLNVLQVVGFLNEFDKSVRFKLSRLNEKLSKVERSLEYCEAALKTSMEAPDHS